MTQPERPDLVALIRELTETHIHREHFTVRRGGTWYGEDHVTTVPPLITQLWEAPAQSGTSEEGPRPAFTSKPAARLEALDIAVRIDLGVARWVKDLGEDDPGDTIACLRLLHSLMPSAHEVTRRKVEKDVRRWWTQARIATGWDSPAWRPDNTCPMCGERGTLRINLAMHAGMCTHDECRETWDQANIGLLADHIRGESEAERVPRRPRVPCACPWPKPIVPDLSRLCPWCGSARCVHALVRRPARTDEAS